MLVRLVRNFRMARWWVKALDLVGRARYAEALNYINLIEMSAENPKTDSRYIVYNQLLKSLALSKLGRAQEAGESINSAMRALAKIDNPSEEVKYLKCYAGALRENIDLSFEGDGEAGPSPEPEIDLRRVPASVRRNFPLRSYPGWTDH